MTSGTGALFWFLAIVALIPLALWLLRRSPMGSRLSGGPAKQVGALALSPSQRVVTIEVGHAEERRWLVLGVAPGGISLLYTLSPHDTVEPSPPTPAEGFAQLLSRLKKDGGDRV